MADLYDIRQEILARRQTMTSAAALNIRMGVEQSPDKAAADRVVAQRLGVPTAAVQADPGLVAHDKTLQTRQVVDNNAVLRDWYAKNPDAAAISHDDVGVLGALGEKLQTGIAFLMNPMMFGREYAKQKGRDLYAGRADLTPANVGRSLGAGVVDLGTGALGATEALSEGFDSAANLIDGRGDEGSTQGLRRWRQSTQAFAETVAPKPKTQAGNDILSGFRSIPGSLAAAGTTLLTGNPYLGATVLGAATGGQSYGQARDEGVGVGRAALKSAIDAAVETGTEIIPEKFLLGDVMAHAGLRKFVWDQVKSEVPFEQAATVLQDFNQWALIDSNHGKTFDQYLGEIEPHAWSTLVSTLVGMAPMAGVGATAQLLDRASGRHAAREEAATQADALREHMQELADLSAASKTRERDAETFHDFVQQATEDTPLEEVYIDPKVLHDTLAQSELEPAQQKIVAERIAPRIAEALEAGTDARVGVADFAAALAGTSAEKVLLDHAKAEPNGMSKVEADEFMAAKGDRLLDEIKAAQANAETDAATKADVESVRTEILDQLQKANRFTAQVNERYADLHAAFYSTMASRLGLSVSALYERYPVRIQNAIMRDSKDVLDQGARHAKVDDLSAHEKADLVQSLAVEFIPGFNMDHWQEVFGGVDRYTDDQIGQQLFGLTDPLTVRRVSLNPREIDNKNRATSPNAVRDYKKQLKKSKAPAILVRKEGDMWKIVEGGHRLKAAQEAKAESIDAIDVTDLANMDWRAYLRGETNDSMPLASRTLGSYAQNDTSPIFYSTLERAVESSPQAKAGADQWLATLGKTPGVKREELEWSGLPDWLKMQGGPVTREELLGFIREGGVQVDEVVLGESDPRAVEERAIELRDEYIQGFVDDFMADVPYPETAVDDDGDETGQWVMGDDYFNTQEEALEAYQAALDQAQQDHEETVSARVGWVEFEEQARAEVGALTEFSEYTEQGGEDYRELLLTLPNVAGPSTHWSEPNVVAHLRFKSRQSTDGKRVMFIEEVQSDWHQKGRDQGYARKLSDDERAELMEKTHAAWRAVDDAGKWLSKATVEALEAEKVRVGEMPDVPMPEVEKGSEYDAVLNGLVDSALSGKVGQLRVQAEWMRKQRPGDPIATALIEYAERQADLLRSEEVKAALEILRNGRQSYSHEEVARRAQGIIGRLGLHDAVTKELTAFRDAEARRRRPQDRRRGDARLLRPQPRQHHQRPREELHALLAHHEQKLASDKAAMASIEKTLGEPAGEQWTGPIAANEARIAQLKEQIAAASDTAHQPRLRHHPRTQGGGPAGFCPLSATARCLLAGHRHHHPAPERRPFDVPARKRSLLPRSDAPPRDRSAGAAADQG
jgi:hypothetical protein